jgi:quercetin dioxygenase-like cupin family protein
MITEQRGTDSEREGADSDMDERRKAGETFSIASEHAPVPGCTVSEVIHDGENTVTVFSLAAGTDISAELYTNHKLILVNDGALTVYGTDGVIGNLNAGDLILTPVRTAVGMRSDQSAVYTEIAIRREDRMNDAVKPGEVFHLAELVPYQDGRVVNMDVVHNDTMKFVVMAFDKGTGLSEHAAPGDALIFALEGKGTIRYEGVDHPIRAGENFRFAGGGLHAVHADEKFKMALLLTLK